jgi:hypothetical protein
LRVDRQHEFAEYVGAPKGWYKNVWLKKKIKIVIAADLAKGGFVVPDSTSSSTTSLSTSESSKRKRSTEHGELTYFNSFECLSGKLPMS